MSNFIDTTLALQAVNNNLLICRYRRKILSLFNGCALNLEKKNKDKILKHMPWSQGTT